MKNKFNFFSREIKKFSLIRFGDTLVYTDAKKVPHYYKWSHVKVELKTSIYWSAMIALVEGSELDYINKEIMYVKIGAEYHKLQKAKEQEMKEKRQKEVKERISSFFILIIIAVACFFICGFLIMLDEDHGGTIAFPFMLLFLISTVGALIMVFGKSSYK